MEGGAANEVWSFGEPAYTILSHLLRLRERFKPYILHHMNLASENGLSIMRPLFMDFPADAACWEVEDSFMFGSDLLVAPITRHDQHERQVYLPAAVRWTDAWTGETLRAVKRSLYWLPLTTYLPSGVKAANGNFCFRRYDPLDGVFGGIICQTLNPFKYFPKIGF